MTTFAKTNNDVARLKDADASLPLYQVRAHGLLAGYVQQKKPNEWLAWNTHGDFWVSFGRTREAAAEAMQVAPWTQFIRAQPQPPVEA